MFSSFANDPFFTSSPFGFGSATTRHNVFDDPFFNHTRIQAPASPTQPLEHPQDHQNEHKYEQKDNNNSRPSSADSAAAQPQQQQQQQVHQQHMDVYDPFSSAFGSDFGFPSMRRMMRSMQQQMNTAPLVDSADPNTSCYTYSSSSVSTRGADGKMHSQEQSHESRRIGGVVEESHSAFDSNGNARFGLKRGLIPKQQSRELTAERNGKGEARQLETIHGLTTEQVPGFDREWDAECAKVDPEKKMLGNRPWDAKQLLLQEETEREKQQHKQNKKLIKNQEKEQQKAIKS